MEDVKEVKDNDLTNVSGGTTLDDDEVESDELETALSRFKRETTRNSIISEVRKREHYEKPILKRKKKAEAARKEVLIIK